MVRKKTLAKLAECLDIRSFFGVHMNLNLLIWLLLSQEQTLLFLHNHNRVVTEYADKEKSKYSTKKGTANDFQTQKLLPEVSEVMLTSMLKPKKAQKAFSKLIGHPVNNEIDKKLLFGIFDWPL